MSNEKLTSYEMSVLFDKQLRISKSGYSLKCGDRIVAKSPVQVGDKDFTERFQKWIDDAEKICDMWNAGVE